MGSIKKTETGSVLNFNTYLPKTLDETKISFTPKQEGSGTPSPENVREIVGKNGITVWQSNKGVFHNLPSAYQEVEYLEGTGTQKIDTGIVIDDSNFNISCRFVLPEYYGTGEYPVFSIWRGTPNYFNCFVRVANRKMSVYTAGHHLPNTTSVEEGVINDIFLSRTDTTWTFTHNEETIDWTYSPTTSNDTTLKVFTRGDGNAASHIRVYYLTVKVGGELVGDFVPCYRKSDSVAGLYDLVTKIFFTNYSNDTNFAVGEDIVGVETSVSFPAVGKNLLDSTKRKDGYYIDATGKEIANSNFGYTTAYTPVEPNETYVLSGNIGNASSANGAIYCYDENKNFVNRLGGWKTTEVPHTFTVPSDTYYINIQYYKVLTDAQIEKGSTATAYEPFDNTIYGGYVDLANGEVVAEWTKVDMGELNWRIAWNTFTIDPSDHANNNVQQTPSEIMCDIYPSDINAPATEVGRIDKNIRGRAGYNHICIRDDDYATAEDFKTAVTGHYIAYKLAEPIHYPIPSRILSTLQGNNVMWSDGDELTISYTDDVVNTYDFRRYISLDTPHKASASGAVASFGTDMVGKMKCKIHFLPKQEGSGTPSPDNVRNISGRSSVKLWQSGKNLVPPSTDTNFWTVGWLNTNGTVSASNNPYLTSDFIKVKGGDTYVLQVYDPIEAQSPSAWKCYGFYDSDQVFISDAYQGSTSTSASSTVVPDNAKYMRISFTSGNRKTGVTYLSQLEFGSVATTYEPYSASNEITFTFPSTVGDNGVVYGGYLDTEKGEVVAEYQKIIIDDTTTISSFGNQSNSDAVTHRYIRISDSGVSASDNSGLSNMFELYHLTIWYYPKIEHAWKFVPQNTFLHFVFENATVGIEAGESDEDRTAKIKAWLANNPITFIVPIKDPIHYSLTPQAIATLRGSNRIWSDGDTVEVEYYKHTDEPQEYLPIDAIVTNNGFVLVTSDGYAVGEANDYIKY